MRVSFRPNPVSIPLRARDIHIPLSTFPISQQQPSLHKRRHAVQHPEHLIRSHLAVRKTPNLASLAKTLETEGEFPALGFVDEEDVFLAVGVADRCTEDVELFGGLVASLVTAVSINSKVKVGKRAYLNHLQCPGLDIPLTLWDAADVVVDEKTFRLDAENKTIGQFTHVGNKLCHRLGESIFEEVDGLDDNLHGVGSGVRTTSRLWGRCAGG